MERKPNKVIKDFSFDKNIDLIMPINEIEINGVSVVVSKLDDYKDRLYNVTPEVEVLNNNCGFISNNHDLMDVDTKLSLNDSNLDMTNRDIAPKNLDSNSDNKKESKNKSVKLESKKGDNPNNLSSKNLRRQYNLKKIKRKKRLSSSILIVSLISVGTIGHNVYTKYKEEQIRLSEYDKDNLDLKLIIDTVDDYGGEKYQLNWQEVASILGITTKNRPEQITEDEIRYVCSLFINKESEDVINFDLVVNSLNLKNKEKDRLYNYLSDLKEYGYMPERLAYDSPQMKFINSIKSGAIKSYKETKILPSITIAQAILESNWGESNLFKESNNLFGIKADRSWKGEYVTFETKEYHSQMIKDKFRKYSTIEDSILDHSKFLSENKRYEEGGVFEAKTYKKQALALQESGYSTAEDENGNKTYAQMLERLIRQYNLQVLDSEVTRAN